MNTEDVATSHAKKLIARVNRRQRDVVCHLYELRDTWFPSQFGHLHHTVRPYTMLSYARLRRLYQAIEHVVKRGIQGDIVECGTARGGSAALMGLALKRLGADRPLWVFDTFEGLPPPTDADPDKEIGRLYTGSCRGELKEVQDLFKSFDIFHHARFIKGLFQNTVPGSDIDKIAVLHIDADWYESVKVCLDHFYDRVSTGGVIQFDDYGHWAGARKAVDEFLHQRGIRVHLQYLDYSGRQLIKPVENARDHDLRAVKLAYEAWHDRLPVEGETDTPWHRLVRGWLRPARDLVGKRILEIGCGRGGFACWLASQKERPSELVASDFSISAIQKGRAFADEHGISGIRWEIGDIQAIAHPDASFDTVISCETVEHVREPRRALCELARVLRPGGRLFLTTPNYLGTLGLYRIYLRLRGRIFTEEGQPINKLMLLPVTRVWVARTGLRIRAVDAVGHYLPFPGRPPIEIPVLNSPRIVTRWLGLHSLIVAEKPCGS